MTEVLEPDVLVIFEKKVQTEERQPYAAYRNSNIAWLGEIPEHWIILKAKRLFKQMNRAVSDGDQVITAFRDGTVTLRTNRRTEGFTNSLLEIGYQGVRKGDLVIHAMDAFAGAIGVSDSDGKATPVYSVCRPIKDANPYYYSYLLKQMANSGYILALARGIRERSTDFRFAEFATLELPVPPPEEQDAIVKFLDCETARIKKLIAKKERMIELLQERRTAIINQAVTRGLDPDVPMKDSGVEWIGKIPEHWEIAHIRRTVKKFVDYRGMTPEKVPSGIPLITARNIKNGAIDFSLSQEFIREEDYPSRMVRGLPAKGDVLVTTEAPLGETAQIIDEHIALAQRIILLKLFPFRMENDYLKYYFLSKAGQGELWSRATGSTAIGIKASHLKEILTVVPPLNEQKAIIAYLDQVLTDIDKPISVIQEGIKKLKEYNAALISAAVTGKIDVRGEAADVAVEEAAL